VGDGQRVEIAEMEKEQAGHQAPDEGHGRQNGVRQVRKSEDTCRHDDCELPAGEKPQQARQEEILEQKLLRKGPDGIAPEALNEFNGTMRRAQGVKSRGNDDRSCRHQQRHANHPERTKQICRAQAHGLPAVKRLPGDSQDEGSGGAVKRPLPRAGRPDNEQNQGVSKGKFQEIAPALRSSGIEGTAFSASDTAMFPAAMD